jgi:ubiquinone/menaquinone biosynthesis C-methylase UbiE
MSQRTADAADAVFAGSVPQVYDTLLVPLIFAPYADAMARRAAALRPGRVLETAAGTGVVTRALADALPADCEIIATDLNPPMLERAAQVGTVRPVQWQVADAMKLPFPDRHFDVVVCQFGVMFFPDRPQAYAEVRRVLRPGGCFLFDVWDDIAHNELADEVTRTLGRLFPDDPPLFMARTPHGHSDTARIARDLSTAGFSALPHIETLALRSVAESPAVAAVAYCQGTPLRNEIESRRPGGLAEATAACADALDRRFGPGPLDAGIQAHVVSALR